MPVSTSPQRARGSSHTCCGCGRKCASASKARYVGRQVHAGFGNQPQSAPLAVAFDAKHVGYGLLCPSVTCIGHHATILIFHRTQALRLFSAQPAWSRLAAGRAARKPATTSGRWYSLGDKAVGCAVPMTMLTWPGARNASIPLSGCFKQAAQRGNKRDVLAEKEEVS